MAPHSKHVLKESYAVKAKLEPFFSGNRIEISTSGEFIFAPCGNVIKIVSVATGHVVNEIASEGDNVNSFTTSPQGNLLVIAYQSGLIRKWDWKETRLEKCWKSIHRGPISFLTFDSSSTYLASGGTDSCIKVWDIVHQYCTHNLKGLSGVTSVIEFHPKPSKQSYLIYGVADDYCIHVWDLVTNNRVFKLEGHCSKVTSIKFTSNFNRILSSSRDKLVLVWDGMRHILLRSIPVFEAIESLFLLPAKQFDFLVEQNVKNLFLTAGEKGVLSIWDYETGNRIFTQEDSFFKQEEGADSQYRGIAQALYCERIDELVVVSFEHNIIFYKLQNLSLIRQLIGFNDEVLDVKFLGEKQQHLAVATNSCYIKVFETETFSCKILGGHKDLVVALEVFRCDPYMLASSSKDNSIRIWKFHPTTMEGVCLFCGTGHSQSVLAIATSCVNPLFVVSAGEDTTMKLWKIPKNNEDSNSTISLNVRHSVHAHEKDINSVTVSPNDQLIASGSQDKTAKIWRTDNFELLGTLRGHKRGIWCIQFSPVDQVVVTSSADATIKIWNLTDYNCLKTFQGHDCSVLKVIFIDRGMQLLTSGSDGNLKIWTVKNNICVKTIDAHDDKLMALDNSRDGSMLVTGAADSIIKIWKDVTTEEKEEKASKQEETVMNEQSLMNLIQRKSWKKALKLAIKLDYPARSKSIMSEILLESEGEKLLNETLLNLREDQLLTLLNYAVTWNTNSRHFLLAHYVIRAIFQKVDIDDLLKHPDIKHKVESLLPYSDRHFIRLNKVAQQATFIEFAWQNMKLADLKIDDKEEVIEKIDEDISIPLKKRFTSQQAIEDVDGSDFVL